MTFRRIVVALGASSSTSAMTAAVEFARVMQAELHGLFVEDTELLALARLPFAGEIGFPSATRRTLDVDAMERGLRAQARRIRQDLTARLAGHPVKWTFEVVRGRIAAELVATAGERDLAIVAAPVRVAGRAGSTAQTAHAFARLSIPLLLVDESFRGQGSIAVVPPAPAAPADIAAVLAALAPMYGRLAQFVLLGAAPLWASWQGEMQALLDEHGIRGRFRVAGNAFPRELERPIAGERPQLVVTLAATRESRESLLDALPYPLLVLPEREVPGAA